MGEADDDEGDGNNNECSVSHSDSWYAKSAAPVLSASVLVGGDSASGGRSRRGSWGAEGASDT